MSQCVIRYEETGIPKNLVIFGSRGSEKTQMIKYLENFFKKDSGLTLLYSNVRYYSPSFKILAQLLNVSSRGLSLGIEFDYWRKSSLFLKINYKNNERQLDVSKTIFGSNKFIGTDKIKLIEGSAGINLDFRNSSSLPTLGTKLFLEYKNGFISNLDNLNYRKFLAIGEGYISFPKILPITFGLKAGAGKSFCEIPFYIQFTLGQNTYLKGYRNNRFTGRSILFMQSELRLHLFI